VPRSDLWLARTPQTFRTDLITNAHERARSDNFVGTDDASLLERLGFEIKIIEDERTNLKITSPADLIMAEIILKALNSDLQPNCS
jgi:2-C-methyl-D-erythritol 4-phosphate cytidylyltransferase